MAIVKPFTREEMYRLARSGVAKVDLLGPRGTTLCTMHEIEAMAAVLALSGALEPPKPALTHAERYGSLAQAIQPIAPEKDQPDEQF